MKLDFHIAYEKLTCACWYCGFCIWMKREQDSEVDPQLFVFPVVYLVYVPHDCNRWWTIRWHWMQRLFLRFSAVLKQEKIQGNTCFSEQLFLTKTVIACP